MFYQPLLRIWFLHLGVVSWKPVLETHSGLASLAGASIRKGQNFLAPLDRTGGLLLLARTEDLKTCIALEGKEIELIAIRVLAMRSQFRKGFCS
ncbi:hypothetical protein ACET3Z_015525 [Daucus carota]